MRGKSATLLRICARRASAMRRVDARSVPSGSRSWPEVSSSAKPSFWVAMTMPFAVKDPAVLAKVEPGRKSEVELQQRGSEFVVQVK